MFSGIVQEIGTVLNIESVNGLMEITLSAKDLTSQIQTGDSIAINGCCQTVVEKNNKSFKVQATSETLSKTNFCKLKIGSKVNLETPLKFGGKIDGHLMSGHIDSTGEVSNILSQDENKTIEILFPKELKKLIANKGSISINGVSLTVIEVKNSKFTFSLIPYTRDNTNLGLLKTGDLVNLEADLISRYLVNYLENNLTERYAIRT